MSSIDDGEGQALPKPPKGRAPDETRQTDATTTGEQHPRDAQRLGTEREQTSDEEHFDGQSQSGLLTADEEAVALLKGLTPMPAVVVKWCLLAEELPVGGTVEVELDDRIQLDEWQATYAHQVRPLVPREQQVEVDALAQRIVCAEHAEELGAFVDALIRRMGELKFAMACAHSTAPAPPAPANRLRSREELTVGPGARSVCWCGKTYPFTGRQAACFQILWKAWQNGTPDVAELDILTSRGEDGEDEDPAGQRPRLSDVFNKGDHPAWKTLIVAGGTKGTFRLAEEK
jgi:hypothetical protein